MLQGMYIMFATSPNAFHLLCINEIKCAKYEVTTTFLLDE